MASVRFENVSKVYAQSSSKAVQQFCLSIEEGEFLVLVGPSGSGKSTLLRMLAGLEEITAGSLFLGDLKVNHLGPKQRNVAMVFQNYSLYPHMTVRQNLAFPLKMAKKNKTFQKRQIEDVASTLGLTSILEKKPGTLSGGQQQRVAIGRAIVREPSLFLMDEPLSNLDAKLRVEIRTEIALLQRKLGTTCVYVTHDQAEAMTLGHRVCVLADGKLQQVDTPQVLYKRPVNISVARFIGSPSMSFFPATVIGEYGLELPGIKKLAISSKSLLPHKVVLVGVRPEDVVICDKSEPGDGMIAVTIDAVERLGHETLAWLSLHKRHRLDSSPFDDLFTDDTIGKNQFQSATRQNFNCIKQGTLVMRCSSERELEIGQTLFVSLIGKNIHLFGPDESRLN